MPAYWKWKKSAYSSVLHRNRSHLHQLQCVHVRVWVSTSTDAYMIAEKRQSRLDSYHEILRTLRMSSPPRHTCTESMSQQELQHPSPCGDFSLLTNLPFTGSPQMALLILPIFKYKRPPGTTQECVSVFASVTRQHAGACLSPRRRVSHLAYRYVFHRKETSSV